MTTIILTVIGIILAAVAALMIIFYGGDAFNSGSVKAQANTLQNAGTNVISAAQLFKTNNAATAQAMTDLTAATGPDGAYLKELPALPDGVTASTDISTGIYSVTGVADDVCKQVNKNLKHADDTTVGQSKMGCVPGASGAAGTFYASL